MIRRSILEWDKLPFREDRKDITAIPPTMAERLAAVARTYALAGKAGEGVLEERRECLKARGVVGVVVAEGCSLEILPKIDVAEHSGGKLSAIRRRLVHMLQVVHDLRIDVGRITELDWQRDDLLEILIRLFSEMLVDAVRYGMPRHYIACEDDLPALHGSIDIARQFTHHAVNPSRLACRFDTLSEDIAINRIMKAAVTHLRGLARSLGNQRRLQELSFIYADISDVAVRELKWDHVVLDRTNERWRELLKMARFLLDRHYQTASSGAGHGFSLLFEMNTLFEAYVGRLVQRALAGSELHAVLQGGLLDCLTDEAGGRGYFQTRPDILIKRGKDVVQVVDSKWKRLSRADANLGVKQGDVYQMMAYGQLYRCQMLTLLYPHHVELGGPEGVQMSRCVTGTDKTLRMATFDVSEMSSAVSRLRWMLLATQDLLRAG